MDNEELHAEVERVRNQRNPKINRQMFVEIGEELEQLRAKGLSAPARERIKRLQDALESITSTAKEVKAENTPEFMEHLAERCKKAEEEWDKDRAL